MPTKQLECEMCDSDFNGYHNAKYCSRCRIVASRAIKQRYADKMKNHYDITTLEKQPGEEIKQITVSGFEHYYITSYGRVFGRFGEVKTRLSKKGYVSVSLCSKGKHKQFTIHRLLALHFLEPPDNHLKVFVDHIDRNRSNNELCNLRWVTPRENALNSDRVENSKGYCLYFERYGNRNGNTYEYWTVQIGRNKKKRFKQKEDAEIFIKSSF